MVRGSPVAQRAHRFDDDVHWLVAGERLDGAVHGVDRDPRAAAANAVVPAKRTTFIASTPGMRSPDGPVVGCGRADQEAALLLAANTGLNLGVLSGLLSGEDAITAIDYRLGKIFKRRSRRGG